MWYKPWPATRFFGNLVEPVPAPCALLLQWLHGFSSFPRAVFSLALKLRAPSGQNTLLYRGIDGCQRLPLLLGNIPLNEGSRWNVYNVGTISDLRGRNDPAWCNQYFFCLLNPHTQTPESSAPRLYNFAAWQLLCVSDAVKCNTRVLRTCKWAYSWCLA